MLPAPASTGDPIDPALTMGALVSEAQFEKAQGLVRSALTKAQSRSRPNGASFVRPAPDGRWKALRQELEPRGYGSPAVTGCFHCRGLVDDAGALRASSGRLDYAPSLRNVIRINLPILFETGFFGRVISTENGRLSDRH